MTGGSLWPAVSGQSRERDRPCGCVLWTLALTAALVQNNVSRKVCVQCLHPRAGYLVPCRTAGPPFVQPPRRVRVRLCLLASAELEGRTHVDEFVLRSSTYRCCCRGCCVRHCQEQQEGVRPLAAPAAPALDTSHRCNQVQGWCARPCPIRPVRVRPAAWRLIASRA